MKTPWLVVMSVVTSTGLWAQGTVNFANDTTTTVSNVLTGSRVIAGTSFSAALYYVPGTNMANPPPNWVFDTNSVQLSPATPFYYAGLFEGGVRTTPATTPPGGSAWFQVRVWETAFGTTYLQAVAAPPIAGRRAIVGTSAVLPIRTGNQAQSTQAPPGSLACSGMQGIMLAPSDGQIPLAEFRIDPVITFNTVGGARYAVEKTPTLSPPAWQSLPGATNIMGTGGPVSVSDPGAGCLDQRYYRVLLLQ